MTYRLSFLSDEQHFAIVNVASRAALLDHIIELSINSHLGPHVHASKFALKNMNTDRLVGFLEAMLLDQFPDDAAAIGELFQTIVGARRDRNELLHWLWGASEKAEAMSLARLRPHHEDRISEKTAEDVMAVAGRMDSAIEALNSFSARYSQGRLDSLREKSAQLALLAHSVSPSDESLPKILGLLGHPPEPSQE